MKHRKSLRVIPLCLPFSPTTKNAAAQLADDDVSMEAKMAKPRDKRLVINFVTSNANKLVEVKAMLEPDFKIVGHPLELVELQGTSEEIVMDKCIRAAKMVSMFPWRALPFAIILCFGVRV